MDWNHFQKNRIEILIVNLHEAAYNYFMNKVRRLLHDEFDIDADPAKETVLFDNAVYTKNRNFRLFLSSKLGKNTIFKVAEYCTFYGSKKPSNRQVFYDSICIPSNASEFPLLEMKDIIGNDLQRNDFNQRCFDPECRGISSNFFPLPSFIVNSLHEKENKGARAEGDGNHDTSFFNGDDVASFFDESHNELNKWFTQWEDVLEQ
uniref:DNA-directed primase/polymerase protein n=1 Tax=Angiostrongylus cantonensis TaxID=6313 RepID=A0A0K0DKH1_ANGCA